jgi:benzodiazapine receptor
MNKRDILPLGLMIIGCEFVGIAGGLFTANEIRTWFSALEKPFLNPPSWIFGPVWTVLYALMAIAVFLVWKKRRGQQSQEVKKAVGLFLVQLLLNALWTPLFFGAHQLGIALLDIALMLIFILLTMRAFFPVSRVAAYLLIPYAAWVLFATYLNAAFWYLSLA